MRLSSKAPKTFALVAAVLLGGATLGLLAARRSGLFLTVPMVVAAVVLGAVFLYGLIRLFLEEQRALRAGMLRPRRGFAVRIREDALEVTMPGQHVIIPTTAIRRALFVRDDVGDRWPGLADALTIYWGDGTDAVRLPDAADGFVELLTWARRNVPFQVQVVKLS